MFIMMFCIVVLFCFGVRTEVEEKIGTKIHFISLNGVTDAILLESDGLWDGRFRRGLGLSK